MSNNPPDRIVALTEEQYQFLLRNCDVNVKYAAQQITKLTLSGEDFEDLIDKLTAQARQFLDVKEALEKSEK